MASLVYERENRRYAARACLMSRSKRERDANSREDELSLPLRTRKFWRWKYTQHAGRLLEGTGSITHTKYIVTPFRKFSAGDVSVQNLQVSTSTFPHKPVIACYENYAGDRQRCSNRLNLSSTHRALHILFSPSPFPKTRDVIIPWKSK